MHARQRLRENSASWLRCYRARRVPRLLTADLRSVSGASAKADRRRMGGESARSGEAAMELSRVAAAHEELLLSSWPSPPERSVLSLLSRGAQSRVARALRPLESSSTSTGVCGKLSSVVITQPQGPSLLLLVQLRCCKNNMKRE